MALCAPRRLSVSAGRNLTPTRSAAGTPWPQRSVSSCLGSHLMHRCALYGCPRMSRLRHGASQLASSQTRDTDQISGSSSSKASVSVASPPVVVTPALPSLHPEELPPLELEHRITLCESGLPDVDECILQYDEPPAAYSAVDEALSRGRWLLGLLIAQSTSSFVLNQYQDLLRDHIVVTLFLTMLVGAGGNAGNQSAIKVIRALATGSMDVSWRSVKSMMADQAMVALLLGGALSIGGFARVYATNGDLTNSFAISISLFMIVMSSVLLGTGLPFALAKIGVDPANAGTSIQVLMDILGVAITCVTCQLVLVQFASGLG